MPSHFELFCLHSLCTVPLTEPRRDIGKFFLLEVLSRDYIYSSSSAAFFCIRRLTCNAAGSPRLSVIRKILYLLIRVQSSPTLMSSNHILLGLPWDSLEFNLPSRTWSKSFPLDPRKTWPAKAIFCFCTQLYKQTSFSLIRWSTSSFEILSVHLIFITLQQHHCSKEVLRRDKCNELSFSPTRHPSL